MCPNHQCKYYNEQSDECYDCGAIDRGAPEENARIQVKLQAEIARMEEAQRRMNDDWGRAQLILDSVWDSDEATELHDIMQDRLAGRLTQARRDLQLIGGEA